MNQVFQSEPPFNILTDLLERFTYKEGDRFIVDYVMYKRILFFNYQDEWLDQLRGYYYENKSFYVTRKFTYVSFINIIRQLCKYLYVDYTYNQDRSQSYKHLKYHLAI